ncbi:MAG: ribonuclease III [Candidatus Amoebophilus sp.]
MDRLINFFRQYFFPYEDARTKQFKNAIYAITTLHPHNLSLYRLALQHSSAKIEENSNERLEFLGDAVLSLVVAEYLFKKYPLQEEGFLTEIRSRIVNRASLGELAKRIGMDELLTYDTRSVNHHNIKFVYGNALEAFIGAVYLDQGYALCAQFIVDRLLKIHVDLETIVLTDNNYKSKIIAWAQKNRKHIQFILITEKRIKGVREFVVQLLLEGEVYGEGVGKTKKQAEQMAAQESLKRIM